MSGDRCSQYDCFNAGITQSRLIIPCGFDRGVAPQGTSQKPGIEVTHHLYFGLFKFPEITHEVLAPVSTTHNGNADFTHAGYNSPLAKVFQEFVGLAPLPACHDGGSRTRWARGLGTADLRQPARTFVLLSKSVRVLGLLFAFCRVQLRFLRSIIALTLSL